VTANAPALSLWWVARRSVRFLATLALAALLLTIGGHALDPAIAPGGSTVVRGGPGPATASRAGPAAARPGLTAPDRLPVATGVGAPAVRPETPPTLTDQGGSGAPTVPGGHLSGVVVTAPAAVTAAGAGNATTDVRRPTGAGPTGPAGPRAPPLR
jgi:hypothetical protein